MPAVSQRSVQVNNLSDDLADSELPGQKSGVLMNSSIKVNPVYKSNMQGVFSTVNPVVNYGLSARNMRTIDPEGLKLPSI